MWSLVPPSSLDEYDVDKALDHSSYGASASNNPGPLEPNLSASLSHDNWSRTKWQRNERRKISDIERKLSSELPILARQLNGDMGGSNAFTSGGRVLALGAHGAFLEGNIKAVKDDDDANMVPSLETKSEENVTEETVSEEPQKTAEGAEGVEESKGEAAAAGDKPGEDPPKVDDGGDPKVDDGGGGGGKDVIPKGNSVLIRGALSVRTHKPPSKNLASDEQFEKGYCERLPM